MYIAVASPQSTTPPTVSTPAEPQRVGLIQDRTGRASADSPITIALEMVPMPGISRSGIHSSSTTKLTMTSASPSVIGRCVARPECRTSHGASPRSPRTISAIERP